MNLETVPDSDEPVRFSIKGLIVGMAILGGSLAAAKLIAGAPSGNDNNWFLFFLFAAILFGLGLSGWFREWLIFGCLVVFLIAAGFLIPQLQHDSGRGHIRGYCQNNLKQLIFACHNFESAYKRFPESAGTNRNADALYPYSWRIEILPYVGQQMLFDHYHFDEPWDGPNNSKLADQMPHVFECPGHRNPPGDFTTPYLAITGPGTIFPDDRPGKLRDTSGIGQSNMIAILECPDKRVHWMKPDDISLDEAIALFSANAMFPPQANHSGGSNGAYLDGSVVFFPHDPAPGELILSLQSMKNSAIQKATDGSKSQ